MGSNAWHLIPFVDAPGAAQMAIDHWLLEQHRLGLLSSCLRFYTWSSPAISLGYHQQHYPAHWQGLTWQGSWVDLVRRPTGGRAVLHQGDLTYALITSGLKGNRREIYQFLCEFLRQGWRRLGVELSLGGAGRGYIHNPNCFGTATSADLVMANGHKLIGSAQVYQDGCVLQHGSMQLQADPRLFEQVFGEEFLPVQLPQNLQFTSHKQQLVEIMSALSAAAVECFGIELEEYTKPLPNVNPSPWQVPPIATQPDTYLPL